MNIFLGHLEKFAHTVKCDMQYLNCNMLHANCIKIYDFGNFLISHRGRSEKNILQILGKFL
jgi:hypothetical protein